MWRPNQTYTKKHTKQTKGKKKSKLIIRERELNYLKFNFKISKIIKMISFIKKCDNLKSITLHIN